MHINTKYFLILGAISFLFFIFSGFIVDSSLKSKKGLASELFSPEDSIYLYHSSNEAPFKYRVLFSSIVKNVYNGLKGKSEDNDLFYKTYVVTIAATYIAAVLAFYYLLLTVGFSNQLSFLGSLVMLISPPVVFAFSIPVHSREDFLGYLILSLGLISILKNRVFLVLLFCILGVLCRETLLILPFLYLFFQREAKIVYRVIVVLLSFSTFFLIRFFAGYESYDVFTLGMMYNYNNLLESFGFLFLCFSFMWIIFGINIYQYYFTDDSVPNNTIAFFRKSALSVFLLVFFSTLVGGRFSEMRLMNLMFPWMIIIFLYYLKKYKSAIQTLVQDRSFLVFSAGLLAILVPILLIILNNISTFLPQGNNNVPYGDWVILTFVHVYIFVLTIFLITKYMFIRESFQKRYLCEVTNDQ